MTAATIAVGASNFLLALVLVWLLSSRSFAIFAGVQSVLLVAGTVAGASIPWVLSREVAVFGPRDQRGRDAVSFSVLTTTLAGVVGGLVTGLICRQFATPDMVVAASASAGLIFVEATVIGYLQGIERFRLIAAARVLEASVKICLGVGLVLLSPSRSVDGAIWGFGVGAAAAIALGLPSMFPAMRLRLSSMGSRELWRRALNLGSIQGGVALLGAIDAVVAAGLAASVPADAASYQVATTVGRIPLFLTTALSMALYPQLVRGGRQTTRLVAVSLTMMLALAVPFGLFAETLPPSLAHAVLPHTYKDVTLYLHFTVITGVAVGIVNLTTTYFQALGRFKASLTIQLPGIVLQVTAVTLGARFGGVFGLAVGAAVAASLSALGMLALTFSNWRGSWRIGVRPLWALLASLPILPLTALHAWLWLVYSIVMGATLAAVNFLKPVSNWNATPSELDHLRVLHLAYEDFRRPGSGGGSHRTHEIDRRLARSHQVTALVAKFPGSRDRIEDGVHYIHIGVPLGRSLSLLAYFACIPMALHRHRADVVIEDFGAPFGSVAAPLMTRRPVVGQVQWLFAREMAHRYRLPFHWVQKVGLRSHREMIAMTAAGREELLSANRRATVHVIHEGVDAMAWETEAREGDYILFLGRLDIAQKGLDSLLAAFSLLAPHTVCNLVIAGDGPDLSRVMAMVSARGLGGRVRFAGRVSGRAKFELIASAQLLLMPSRYETFGIVAAESLACRTPVVAFDLPCLREVVPPDAGELVGLGDISAFAGSVLGLLSDGARRAKMGEAGRRFSLRFSWDQAAILEDAVLREVVRSHPQGLSMRARIQWLIGAREDEASGEG
jgi:glycosyltransferase involved in cell wall biosynthesis/O-antigen/teichoic acid export membrane protein